MGELNSAVGRMAYGQWLLRCCQACDPGAQGGQAAPGVVVEHLDSLIALLHWDGVDAGRIVAGASGAAALRACRLRRRRRSPRAHAQRQAEAAGAAVPVRPPIVEEQWTPGRLIL